MIKKIFLFVLMMLVVVFFREVSACSTCSTEIGEAVRSSLFDHGFLIILSIIAGVFFLFFLASIGISYLLAKIMDRRFLFAGMLFGGAIAGLLDSIVFHQLLQWHNMIANIVPVNSLVNAEINMFWDGVFHAHILLIMLIATVLFFRAMQLSNNQRSGLILTGSIFVGAGMFNLIEGLIDHYVFQLHHVVQKNNVSFMLSVDLMFILASVVVIILGSLCLKSKGVG